MSNNSNPNKIAWKGKMNAVRNELKATLNRRRGNLQKGEQTFESIGGETARNANANKAYMNKLRRGSNTPENAIRKAAMTRKNTNLKPLGKYVKTTGLNSTVKELKCVKNATSSNYRCQTGGKRKTYRRKSRT